AGVVDDDLLAALEKAAAEKFLQGRNASCALRGDEHAFIRSKLDSGVDELLVADGDGRAAAVAYRFKNEKIAERLRHAEAGGYGVGVVPELAALLTLLVGAHDRLAAFDLHRDHLGTLASDPAERFHFLERFPHPDDADSAAGGIENHVGKL